MFLAVGAGFVALGALNAARFWTYGVAFYEWQWRHYDRLAGRVPRKSILSRVYFAVAGPESGLRDFNRHLLTFHYRWIVSVFIACVGALLIAEPFR